MNTCCFVIVPKGDGYTVQYRLADGRILVETVLYTTLDSAKRAIRSILTYVPTAPVQAYDAEERLPNPKLEMYRSETSYFFRFRARNGKLTIASRIFTDPVNCREGIRVLQETSACAPVFIELERGLVDINEYTEEQVALFLDSQFKKQEKAPVSPEPPGEAPKAETPKKKGFFSRFFK